LFPEVDAAFIGALASPSGDLQHLKFTKRLPLPLENFFVPISFAYFASGEISVTDPS